MNPSTRTVSATIGLVLVFVTTQPGAVPRFSDWAMPANLGPVVNSSFQDFGPAISRDGLSLYFTSDRPGGFGSMDIWVSQRAAEADEWGPALNLGGVINSAASENVPALSRDGHWLFFNSNRPGGLGGQDIWVAWREHTHDDFGWDPPFNLGAGVNSTAIDVNPSFFENDEGAAMLFFTSNRPSGPGVFDIYVSVLGTDGSFGMATRVPELSSPAQEQRPSVRFDGLEIFFHSDRPGSEGNDVWVSTRDTVTSAWPNPVRLGSSVNTASSDQQPYVATDRRTLFFASNRPGGVGALDLYVTTRSKSR